LSWDDRFEDPVPGLHTQECGQLHPAATEGPTTETALAGRH
jgi:hypothetical protein